VVLTLDKEFKVSFWAVGDDIVLEPLELPLTVDAEILGVKLASPANRFQCQKCEVSNGSPLFRKLSPHF